MKWKVICTGMALGIFYFSACKKDLPSYTPTPYEYKLAGSKLPSTYIDKLPAYNPTTNEGVSLGRLLFYDNILSLNYTQNCGSCHAQAYAFTDANKALSRGVDGSFGKRNSMPLINLMWNTTFFWDGRSPSLEDQALKPIVDVLEMKSNIDTVVARLNAHPVYPSLFYKAFGTKNITKQLLAQAIAQFERTLISENSKYDRVVAKPNGIDTFTASELRGYNIFRGNNPATDGDCIHCHTDGGTFTDFSFRNNGLDATLTDLGRQYVTNFASDAGKFKTPTLRNIGLTAPYMHDGRFKTLEEVMTHYNENFHSGGNLDPVMDVQVKARLTLQQKKDIIAFLHTLTDSSFANNPAFSKPK